MKKTYFKITPCGSCIDFCPENDSVGIGSIVCQNCEKNLEYDIEKQYIICEELNALERNK